jgi:MFS superfamily sulfate permease-like transporter
MAYAGIVGVPPIMGLITIVPPLIAYALLGTSRLLVVGPDTATGLISALTVGALAAQGTLAFDALTSTLAILIGAFFLLFGALRMGWVAAFIPTPVMRGFIEGLVLVTIIGQLPELLGISGGSGNFFQKLGSVLQHLPDASLGPLARPRRAGLGQRLRAAQGRRQLQAGRAAPLLAPHDRGRPTGLWRRAPARW